MFNIRQCAVTLLLLLLSTSITHQRSIQPPSPEELQLRYGDALEAILSIAIRVQALLDDPDVSSNKNFMVSPLSVALIVGQLMLGAEGRFRKELYNLLSLPEANDASFTIQYHGKDKNASYSLPYAKLHLQLGNLVRALEGNELSRSFTLNTNNALFTNTNLKLKNEFLHNLEIYDTDVQPANFTTDPVGSMNKINDWASANTNGLIKKVLAQPLPPSAAAVFTNAIYFRADWETPFSYELNKRLPFYSTKDTVVEVEYMRRLFEEGVKFGESKKLNCQMIAFPYKNHELAMYFMIPNENNGEEYNIGGFAEKLKTKDVLDFISQLKEIPITIQMPKMKLTNNLSILKPLQKYSEFRRQQNNSEKGDNVDEAVDILEGRVDEFSSFNTTKGREIILTGAADNKKFQLANILQQMTLNVDEKGTEAAAVSLSDMYYIDTRSFRIERPFVFFIRHELTSATLFWGTIVDPSQTE